MYTEHELTNIQSHKQDQILSIVGIATMLVKILKPFDFGEYNKGLKMAEEAIVRGYCTIHMAHMDESDFEEMLTNTLAYFATGLYDCEKISGGGINANIYPVAAWRYTPETHNNAGYWFHIYTFEKISEAIKCAAMLKAIGAELDELQKNY
jgi:hypothetical protein